MRRRAQRHSARPAYTDRVSELCHRAFRFRRRGDDRRAMLLLREAALENEDDARLWTLYGVQCKRIGRYEAARQALTHAVWLRERRREPAKARVTRALLSDMNDRAA